MMQSRFSKKALAAVLTVAAACFVQSAFAQGSGGPPIPINVPVDGGVTLLAAIGGAFAARSLRRK